MRNIFLLSVALLACAASARAVELAPQVQIPVTGFKAVLKDGLVHLSWRRYRRDDFLSCVVVKSDKDSDPAYPGTAPVVTFSAPEGRSWDDGKLAVGTWNYRLVITTRYGDRWVSPVVPVVIGAGDLHRAAPGESDFAD